MILQDGKISFKRLESSQLQKWRRTGTLTRLSYPALGLVHLQGVLSGPLRSVREAMVRDFLLFLILVSFYFLFFG